MGTEKETGHERKRERMCQVMAECCAGMSDEDKRKMMDEMMPHMMEMMGGDTGSGMMGTMMRHFLRAFQWVALVPIGIGAVLFALGYFLDAEVVRILWLILAALPILIGVIGIIMISAMGRMFGPRAPTA